MLTDGGEVVSLKNRPASISQKLFFLWYSVLFEAE
jgi:hypothetical protein